MSDYINWQFIFICIAIISVIAFLRGFMGEAIKDIRSYFKK